MRVIDGLLSRSDNSQQEEMSTESIEDHAALDTANKEYTTGENYLRQERSNKEVDSVDREMEVDEEEKPPLFLAKCRQRRSGIVSVTNEGQLGLPNFGFENERNEEIEKKSSSDTSGLPRQKRSVTLSLSKLPVQPLMNRDGEECGKPDASVARLPTVTGRSQEKDKETECVENVCNPLASEYKQEVLDLPVSSPTRPAKKLPLNTIKYWLRDPKLYKVAIIFTCTSLVRNTVYTYLPLFLTERLQFAKEAVAYFPLVLLISAAFSSITCGKLNKKIGTKWSYLLAAAIVICGVVWSYFQTPPTKQMAYGPVVLIGSGISVMFVMSLAFITELIGDNKDTSGLVISIIVVINRVSSGGIVIGIQSFYPEKDSNSNEAISHYVQHVFVMAPGLLTLVGSLLVLSLPPSVLACRTKGLKDKDIQADEDKCSPDEVTSQFSSNDTATPTVSLDVNQDTTVVLMHSCSQDSKL